MMMMMMMIVEQQLKQSSIQEEQMEIQKHESQAPNLHELWNYIGKTHSLDQ
jgi:hypothetical protein